MGKWGGGIIFWGPFFHKKCPFVNNMNDLLYKHASLKKKKNSKYKLKFKTKPWITATPQKSISIKHALSKT